MLGIKVNEGTTTDICHTCTAKDAIDIATIHGHIGVATRITFVAATIDITANDNLSLHSSCCKDHAQTKYRVFNFHFSTYFY